MNGTNATATAAPASFDLRFIDAVVEAETEDALRNSYEDPNAADNLAAIYSDPQYTLYRDCFDTLALFAGSSIWTRECQKPLNYIFDLGSGTGEKLAFLAKNIAGVLPSTVLIDISTAMLRRSWQTVAASLFERARGEIIPIRADFKAAADMAVAKRSIAMLPSDRSAAFCLGGTFGNGDERKIARSVHGLLASGDLAVFGVEFHATIDGHCKPPEEFMKPYQAPAIAKYFIDSMKSRDSMAGGSDTILIEIEVADSVEVARYGYSDLDDVASVTMVATNVTGKRVIAHSNRYDQAAFNGFFAEMGFEKVESIASPGNPAYRYEAFRRV